MSVMSPILLLFHHFDHPFQIYTFFPNILLKIWSHSRKESIFVWSLSTLDPNALMLKKLFINLSISSLASAGAHFLWLVLTDWTLGFLCDPVVGNLPCNTEDVHLIPGREAKTPYVTGQPNPRTTTTEPMSCGAQARACAQQRRFCCYN